MDVEQIADGLYGLPPPEFTAAREQAAARSRAAGDPATADRVHRLRRPTLAAWLANLLVREHPEELRGLLELASGLREAQARLDGDQLRELTQRRRAVVAALTSQAGQAATRAGLSVGEGPLGELEQTLQAALTDPAVADAVASGRLTSARNPGSATGPGPRGSLPESRLSASRPRAPAGAPSRAAADRTRQLTEAQQLSARAAEQAEAAEAAAGKARAQLDQAAERRQRLREQIDQLSERLDQLRTDERRAAATERDARTRVESTDREARRAGGRARDAADRLRHLDQRAA